MLRRATNTRRWPTANKANAFNYRLRNEGMCQTYNKQCAMHCVERYRLADSITWRLLLSGYICIPGGSFWLIHRRNTWPWKQLWPWARPSSIHLVRILADFMNAHVVHFLPLHSSGLARCTCYEVCALLTKPLMEHGLAINIFKQRANFGRECERVLTHIVPCSNDSNNEV